MRRIVLFSIVCGVAVFGSFPRPLTLPAAFSSDTSVEQRLFFQAEGLCRLGKCKDAQADLKRVLKLNPAHGGALYFAAVIERERGNVQRAAELLKQAERDPDYGPRARRMLAELKIDTLRRDQAKSADIFVENGAYDQGLIEAQKALDHDPHNPNILFQTVFTATLTGHQDAATRALQQLESLPVPPSFFPELQHFVEGWFMKDSDPRGALSRFLGITDRRLLVPTVRTMMRKLLLQGGHHEEYEQFMLKELREDLPHRQEMVLELARFYGEQGLFERGIALLEEHAKASRADPALYVEFLAKAGQDLRALGKAGELLEQWPDDQDLRDAALQAFLQIERRSRSLLEGKSDKGVSFFALADREIARLINSPTLSTIPPESLYLGAQVALALQQTAEAAALCRLAVSQKPSPRATEEGLLTAKRFSQAGDVSAAQKILEALRIHEPDHVTVKVLLAELYCGLNRYSDALRLLEQVGPGDIRNIQTFGILIDSLAACGRAEEAQAKVLTRLEDPYLPRLLVQPLKHMAFKLADIIEAQKQAQ
jgi:tetratricopeptide (TPR) repeat protein